MKQPQFLNEWDILCVRATALEEKGLTTGVDELDEEIRKFSERVSTTFDPRYLQSLITLGAVMAQSDLPQHDYALMVRTVYEMLKDNVNYNVTFQQEIYRDEYWLEIMPKTASKANAILKLKEILKCDEIVCFGDAINDLEMFKVSNQSYAMENAVDQLKKHATAIIDSNENDGVANWLIKNFK